MNVVGPLAVSDPLPTPMITKPADPTGSATAAPLEAAEPMKYAPRGQNTTPAEIAAAAARSAGPSSVTPSAAALNGESLMDTKSRRTGARIVPVRLTVFLIAPAGVLVVVTGVLPPLTVTTVALLVVPDRSPPTGPDPPPPPGLMTVTGQAPAIVRVLAEVCATAVTPPNQGTFPSRPSHAPPLAAR